MRNGSSAYAASTHLLCRTLSDCAWLAQPAPDVYKDLGGAYGLCKHDPVWAVLDTAEPPPLGTRCVFTPRLHIVRQLSEGAIATLRAQPVNLRTQAATLCTQAATLCTQAATLCIQVRH